MSVVSITQKIIDVSQRAIGSGDRIAETVGIVKLY
jgi:hypothetical protein